MQNKKAFTLIELLIIVAIIGLLASAILVSIGQSRKNARINTAKTSLKSILPMVISCLDSKGPLIGPDSINNGGNTICGTVVGGSWPVLANGYRYVNGNLTNPGTCFFTVSTSNDNAANLLTCSCATQLCE